MEYKQDPAAVDTILTAIENVRSRKPLFMKAYALNVELPMVIYNLIVAAIEQCVSFMIAVCIQFIKDPNSSSINAALDTVAYANSKDNMLYEQLVSFNNGCVTKDLDSVLNDVIKNGGRLKEECDAMGVEYPDSTPFAREVEPTAALDKEPEPTEERIPVNGATEEEPVDVAQQPVPYEQNTQPVPVDEFTLTVGTVATVSVLGAAALSLGLKGFKYLLKFIIPMIRNITYWCINSRVTLSDSLAIQAQLIEANAYKLQYSTNSGLTEEKKNKVVQKQLKIAEKLKAWANKLAINDKKATVQAQKDIDQDKDQLKKDDIDVPNDIDGSLF